MINLQNSARSLKVPEYVAE